MGWILGQEDPLEEDMATHSSIPAWRIPGTEKLGRLQSVGLQRVRPKGNNKHHNFSDHFLYGLYLVLILTYSSSTHWLFSPKVLADSSKNFHRFCLLLCSENIWE